jgi:hypothetical protein
MKHPKGDLKHVPLHEGREKWCFKAGIFFFSVFDFLKFLGLGGDQEKKLPE